eukprot:TRINITY_DN26424_c0_g5_i1.p2 TRINITY_DN26424_c0_g5~~TRINITY_DN26424_c0_g5_i1.p2  ORF type:complete len:177 (-),score=19.43 TRINITY_DN26424_c0_g5_i1:573-1103(-)
MADIKLCIRHVPCKITANNFRDAMVEFGLDVSRYVLHFPTTRKRDGHINNFGYGFVTCRAFEDSEAFRRAFQGFRFETVRSSKRLCIEPAASSMHSAGFPSSTSSSSVGFGVDALANDVVSAIPNGAAARIGFEAISVAAPRGPLSASNAPPMNSVGLRIRVPDPCELPPTRLTTI